MVIINTKAAEVSIHALSPLSSFAGGAGAAALGAEGTAGGAGVSAGAPNAVPGGVVAG